MTHEYKKCPTCEKAGRVPLGMDIIRECPKCGHVEDFDVDSLLARCKELEAACVEQAKLNGKGAEREAGLLGKIADLERRLAWREGTQETHYEGCWQVHKECALARIAELEGKVRT